MKAIVGVAPTFVRFAKLSAPRGGPFASGPAKPVPLLLLAKTL